MLHRDEDLAWLSLRNSAAVQAIAVGQLNAYDVLISDAVVFTGAALEAYVSVPAKGKSSKAVSTPAEPAEIAELDDADDDDVVEDAEDAQSPDYGPGSFVGEEPPSDYMVKGNADSMKYHTPESPYYARTVTEVWFDSAESAEEAGFSNVQGDAGAEDFDEEGADDK